MRIYPSKNFPFKEFAVSADYPDLAKTIILTDLDKFKIYSLSIIMNVIRSQCGNTPMVILSGKRTPELNTAVKGSLRSDHLYVGNSAAADFTFKRNKSLYLWDAFSLISMYFENSFGQLILYFKEKNIDKPTFIHLSLPTPRHKSERKLYFNNEYISLKNVNKYPEIKDYLI